TLVQVAESTKSRRPTAAFLFLTSLPTLRCKKGTFRFKVVADESVPTGALWNVNETTNLPHLFHAHRKWGMGAGEQSTRRVMSALGQKRTSHQVRVMSALPPKADIVQHHCDVRFVPKADIRRLYVKPPIR